MLPSMTLGEEMLPRLSGMEFLWSTFRLRGPGLLNVYADKSTFSLTPLTSTLLWVFGYPFLSMTLARAHASTDKFFFRLWTLMKLTTPVDSEFPSLTLQ